MDLRRRRRTVADTTFEYWTLVESRRTASGPRQHTVATLGKLPGLDEKVQAGWDAVDDLLAGRLPIQQLELATPNQPAVPLWREDNVHGVRVGRVGEFGEVSGSCARETCPERTAESIVVSGRINLADTLPATS